MEKYNRFARSPASQVRGKEPKVPGCGGAGGSRLQSCGEQCWPSDPVNPSTGLGAGWSWVPAGQERGQGTLPHPKSHSLAPDNGKQKEELKTISRQQVWFKEFISDKKFPTKKSYKKSRDKEWLLQKCSQIEKTHLSNPSTEPKARWLWLCTARDCLSEGMQRSSAPKLCSGPPAASRVSPWHTLEAPHHNIQLTFPTLIPTPVSTGCCCVLAPPGPPTPLWAQHQGLPAQFHSSHQHLWLPPALPWASLSLPWPPGTAPTPRAGTSLGAGFSPIMEEAPAHCAGLGLILRNQLSFSL